MSPPPVLPADIPPRLAEMLDRMQKRMGLHIKFAYGAIATLATGLVSLTVFCLQHR